MTSTTLLIAGAAAFVIGVGGAAWILRWEIRAQRRERRHRGYLIGGRP